MESVVGRSAKKDILIGRSSTRWIPQVLTMLSAACKPGIPVPAIQIASDK